MDESLIETLVADGYPWKIMIEEDVTWAQVTDHTDSVVTLLFPVEETWRFANQLSSGDPMRVEVTQDSGIYRFEMKFRSLVENGDRFVVTAKVGEALDRTQRRDAYRVKLLVDAKVGPPHVETPEPDEEIEALIRDLSETGARLSVRTGGSKLAEGATISVVFYVSGFGGMAVRSEVRWIHARAIGNEIGVRFMDQSSGDSNRLRKYLWNIQRMREEGDRGSS